MVFTTFCQKFNWAYFDGYELEQWRQFGFGFSLVLLNKYGNLNRKTSFYAEKYYTALPDLLDFNPITKELKNSAYNCYCYRTFERGLLYFGFVTYERELAFDSNYVMKTKLFDAFISVKCKKAKPIKQFYFLS